MSSPFVLHLGDALDVLAKIEPNSVDSLVTDPPASISFMGKEWDDFGSCEYDPTFGNWLAGFVDGEGCFRIHKEKGGEYYACHFSIKLRQDDRRILEQIHAYLKVGRVFDQHAPSESRPNDNPQSVYIVDTRADCQIIREVFSWFPLRAKKAREFDLWCRALDAWLVQGRGNRWHGPADKSAMAALWEEMKGLRLYSDLPVEVSVPSGGSGNPFVDQMVPIFRECLRVMKPGAYGLVWSLPRTSHWTACALEDAGFEVRDKIAHFFGQGFPKSMDVSKAIDKVGGADIAWFGPWLRAERERRGITAHELAEKGKFYKNVNHGGLVVNWELGYGLPTAQQFNKVCELLELPFTRIEELEREVVGSVTKARAEGSGSALPTLGAATAYKTWDITIPATEAAKKWEGWGTALKPAREDWILVRKPLDGTVAANVLEHGVGGINIDGCRVPGVVPSTIQGQSGNQGVIYGTDQRDQRVFEGNPGGRFPTNLLLSHSPECKQVGTRKVKSGIAYEPNGKQMERSVFGATNTLGRVCGYAGEGGLETVDAWECIEGCPVKALDEQSGTLTSGKPSGTRKAYSKTFGQVAVGNELTGYGDQGGASRFFPTFESEVDELFFYCPKAPSKDKGGKMNTHPTVKHTKLMNWLITLITPPGGVVLDPFTGSGSTGVAAVRGGWKFVGIERETEYHEIALKRIEAAMKEPK